MAANIARVCVYRHISVKRCSLFSGVAGANVAGTRSGLAHGTGVVIGEDVACASDGSGDPGG
jgi:hypothetical protein